METEDKRLIGWSGDEQSIQDEQSYLIENSEWDLLKYGVMGAIRKSLVLFLNQKEKTKYVTLD